MPPHTDTQASARVRRGKAGWGFQSYQRSIQSVSKLQFRYTYFLDIFRQISLEIDFFKCSHWLTFSYFPNNMLFVWIIPSSTSSPGVTSGGAAGPGQLLGSGRSTDGSDWEELHFRLQGDLLREDTRWGGGGGEGWGGLRKRSSNFLLILWNQINRYFTYNVLYNCIIRVNVVTWDETLYSFICHVICYVVIY